MHKPSKKEARPTVESKRATVKKDQQIISPWTPRAQAALVADFVLFAIAGVAMMQTGVVG